MLKFFVRESTGMCKTYSLDLHAYPGLEKPSLIIWDKYHFLTFPTGKSQGKPSANKIFDNNFETNSFLAHRKCLHWIWTEITKYSVQRCFVDYMALVRSSEMVS